VRLAVSSEGKTLDSSVSMVFGRCPYFLIVEGGKLVKVLENTSAEVRGGAGPAAVKLIAEQSVQAVIAGRVGPRALQALEGFGIKVFLKNGLIKEVIKEVE